MTDDNAEDEPSPTAASTDADEASAPEQLLQAVQDEIDEVRRRTDVGEGAEDDEKSFIEEGAEDEDEPVDDTIAPPG